MCSLCRGGSDELTAVWYRANRFTQLIGAPHNSRQNTAAAPHETPWSRTLLLDAKVCTRLSHYLPGCQVERQSNTKIDPTNGKHIQMEITYQLTPEDLINVQRDLIAPGPRTYRRF
jgi:hypothetical protein